MQLCRISVVGPAGRADLAVPVSTTVASLMPVLLRHTTTDAGSTEPSAQDAGPWVLQRLGQPPLDPDGTPEILDWLDGEELYLRPADDVMPELDFDDVADGMALAVSRKNDHWRPEFRRPLCVGLAAAVLAASAVVTLLANTTLVPAIGAAVYAIVLLAAMVGSVHRSGDRSLSIMLGLAGCGFAGIAGAISAAGTSAVVHLNPRSMLAGGMCAVLAALVVLSVRRWRYPAIAAAPFGVVGLSAFGLVVGMSLKLSGTLSTTESASVLAVVFFVATLVAPKLAVRFARLSSPQLPHTAADLQIDTEPAKAKEVIDQTMAADRYLTVITVSAALIIIGCLPILLHASGWAPPALDCVLSLAVVLRARDYRGAWQRSSLAVAGTVGLLLVIVSLTSIALVSLAVLLVVVAALVTGTLRPLNRRPAPIWVHVANILETLSTLAILPVLLQLFGVYAWARGLGG
jgi:type VII secretion integral membrane protein EccD